MKEEVEKVIASVSHLYWYVAFKEVESLRRETERCQHCFMWSFPLLLIEKWFQNLFPPPQFLSLSFFVPFPIILNYQQVLKEEEGIERWSSVQCTILLPTAAFLLPFLAEECGFLAFGVFQLLGIQNICGFLKNNFGNCISAEALGLEMPSVT